jgi:hypothetical protein
LKTCFLLFSAVLLTASIAAATDIPKAQAFLGYNWVRFSPDTPNLPGFNGLPSFDLNGGNGQLVYNFKPWIGAVLDVGAVHAGSLFRLANNVTPNRPGVDHKLTNFVFGSPVHLPQALPLDAVCAGVVWWLSWNQQHKYYAPPRGHNLASAWNNCPSRQLAST